MDKKNLHNNASGQPYPEPDVPVEDAWDNMKQLLQHAAVVPAPRSKFSFGKGIFRFIVGSGVVAIVSVITCIVVIKKGKPAPSKVHYTSNTKPATDTLQNGSIAYQDKQSRKRASHEFSNTPFKEAAKFLEKAYGVTIIVKNDKIYNCKITARFDNNSLEEMLDIMGYTLAFKYKIDQKSNQVTISGDGCN